MNQPLTEFSPKNTAPAPLSLEAQRVRDALLARGLETPLVENGLDRQQKYERIRNSFEVIAETLGLDLTDDSLQETPHRIAKMYVDEIFGGLDYARFPKISVIDNKMQVEEMVLVDHIDLVSTCEHHFVTIDGRAGATGAAPKLIKFATSVPSIFALYRARRALQNHGAEHISLIITGGLRVSPDFAKALALGTAALMACGCQQYRICDSGNCPMGITTQDPELRKRFDTEAAAARLANFLRVSTEEIKTFARITGKDDIHHLSVGDLCTTSSEISEHTSVRHC